MGSTSIMHKWNNVCQQQFYALKRMILLRDCEDEQNKKKKLVEKEIDTNEKKLENWQRVEFARLCNTYMTSMFEFNSASFKHALSMKLKYTCGNGEK